MSERSTGVNALIGGTVAIFTAPFFPLSPILGGAVAGYLERGASRDGAIVGAIAGVIALLPFFLGAGLFGGVLFFGPMGMGMGAPGGFAALSVVFLVFGLVFLSVYLVGFAALGGVIGAYVATETDIGR